MVPEDLVFWLAPLTDPPVDGASVLCERHADAMMVPRGWTLDDRREEVLRLFGARPYDAARGDERRGRARPARRTQAAESPEQLQIDGTGEVERPDPPTDGPLAEPAAGPWEPEYDPDDDLDGLLAVNSPLLARAFRGTDRPKR